jgi:hypothetical protein
MYLFVGIEKNSVQNVIFCNFPVLVLRDFAERPMGVTGEMIVEYGSRSFVYSRISPNELTQYLVNKVSNVISPLHNDHEILYTAFRYSGDTGLN